jgi:ribosomal protein L37AE/L43A
MTTFSKTFLITGFETTMPLCPCCSDLLLHHIRGAENYWFCRSCWQEMPVLTQRYTAEVPKPILATVSQKTFTSEHHLSSYSLSYPNSLQSKLETKWERKTVSSVSVEI